MASVSTIAAATVPQGLTDGKPSVALQDKLSRCIRQLGDWQACPSGKTPEGKRIIENLQSQIRSMESRIASAGTGAGAQPPATSAAPRASQGHPVMGRLVDVFA